MQAKLFDTRQLVVTIQHRIRCYCNVASFNHKGGIPAAGNYINSHDAKVRYIVLIEDCIAMTYLCNGATCHNILVEDRYEIIYAQDSDMSQQNYSIYCNIHAEN